MIERYRLLTALVLLVRSEDDLMPLTVGLVAMPPDRSLNRTARRRRWRTVRSLPSSCLDLKLVSRLEFGSGAVAMRYEPRR